MVPHNHIAQGDAAGCPACASIRPESQVHPHLVPALPVAYIPTTFEPDPDEPGEPDVVKALPDGVHRISDGRAVCGGGREHRCHWYPGCDCEAWPCGHEYVFHDDCWVIGWLDAVDLTDTNDDWEDRDDEDRWPDGVIDWEWMGEGVTWSYVSIDRTPEGELEHVSLPDGRRESDVPLWEESHV